MKKCFSVVILLVIVTTSCTIVDWKYFFPMAWENHYEISEYNVLIKRKTTFEKSEYSFYKDGEYLGTYYWNNLLKDQRGLSTDGYTWYYISIDQKNIFLIGEQWFEVDMNPNDGIVIPTWHNKPNDYYLVNEFNTLKKGEVVYAPTSYLLDIRDSPECITIPLKRFPEWEGLTKDYPTCIKRY